VSPTRSQAEPLVGRTLAHYSILEKLGEGGMGVVYKARDTHLDRLVAIKLLPLPALDDEHRRLRFVREAKAASALNHPNIVTIHDISQADGVDFIAMEFVPGKTLGEMLGRKHLPLADTLRLGVQIADALAAAHAAGIIHRDIKPGNIMVTENGLVKVLDFGLAKLSEPVTSDSLATRTLLTAPADRTEEGKIVGTIAYMSPEQARESPRMRARTFFRSDRCYMKWQPEREHFKATRNSRSCRRFCKKTPNRYRRCGTTCRRISNGLSAAV